MKPVGDRERDDASGVDWRLLYVLVLVELGVLVAAFYALTRWAA